VAAKVSMEDIAKELGLSKNTVSLALRGMPGISGQTRSMIIDTAERMGYQYKKQTKNCIEYELPSRNICLVLPKNTREAMSFFSFIQFGIEDEAKRNNINVIIYYYDEASGDFQIPLCIREGIISGVITLGRISEQTLKVLSGLELPLVLTDHYFDNNETDSILSDNHFGGYSAAEFLYMQGHCKIGFVGDIKASNSFYDRFHGYMKFMVIHQLPVDASWQLTNTSFEKQKLDLSVEQLKSIPELPTAFFCCNDAEAIAMYKAFSAIGIKVPEEVSIIGFDDIEAAKSVQPELTTMHVEKEHMGKKAVEKLLMKMQTEENQKEKLLISPRLIVRQSVRKI
jgi:LacI family transcriptional regulator